MAEQQASSSGLKAAVTSQQPLHIAFLWHQHQPYYKADGSYLMPWVRFHGVKDYYDMVRILDDYPKIRQNFNLVPSLLIQLEDYINNGAEDAILTLTRKSPSELTEKDKKEVLRSFFIANFERMIKPYARYLELFQKRGASYSDKKFAEVGLRFTEQDWLDLQVWYNMTWVGEYSKHDPPFKRILEKGRDFTEDDKKILLDGHMEILKRIIPKHKEAQSRGQIEVSVSPFYHPILPLLCDTDIARLTATGTAFPKKRFCHPEDAEAHIQRALEHYEHIFGRKPLGMWPSEGSVSEEVLNLLARHEIQWTASDEEVLFKSFQSKSYGKLYCPYQYKTPSGVVKIVFRDHTLSDLIGFVYAHWSPDHAASDFVNRLHSIREKLLTAVGADGLSYALVSIVLDGENCWEYYQSDGKDFLRTLYWLLSKDDLLKTTTIGDFVATRKCEALPRLFPGSWINANFKIWIGHEEDNKAWDLLTTTRDFLLNEEQSNKYDEKVLQQAWEEIYIAEGSDWCWWYGDEHTTANIDEFDLLFRSHLIRVYELLGVPRKQVPEELKHSIRKKFGKFFVTKPTRHIHPSVDGARRSAYEWNGAGYFDALSSGGAMHQVSTVVRRIYYGYDEKSLYLRVDTSKPLTEKQRYLVRFTEPFEMLLEFSRSSLSVKRVDSQQPAIFSCSLNYAIGEVFEVSMSLSSFGWQLGSRLAFDVTILEDGREIESLPREDLIKFTIKSQSVLEKEESGNG